MAPQAHRLGKNHPGAALWLVDGRFSAAAALESADLLFATQQGGGFARSADSARILASANTPALKYAPAIRADGLELFFTWVESIVTGTPSLWRTSRPTPQDAFGVPEQVTAAAGFVEGPTLSPDGRSLYFHRLENGTFKIFRVAR
ncbi:MAG: TolB family protein [Myxococcaceae bacterium]